LDIKIDDLGIGLSRENVADEIGPDKAQSPGHENFHYLLK
jgi:hypothetical protein